MAAFRSKFSFRTSGFFGFFSFFATEVNSSKSGEDCQPRFPGGATARITTGRALTRNALPLESLELNFFFEGRNLALINSPERKCADALMKQAGRLLRWGEESCRRCKCHKVSIYYAMLRQLTNVRVNSNRGILPRKTDVPAEGIEPTRSCDHWILSPARLPVPPRRREGIKLQKRSRSSSISRRVRTQRASLPLARASLLAGEYVFSVG